MYEYAYSVADSHALRQASKVFICDLYFRRHYIRALTDPTIHKRQGFSNFRMNWRRTLSYSAQYFWPIMCGLLLAVAIAALAPEWLNGNNNSTDTDEYSQVTDGAWSGPVSYAEAARRAAPSVVNIYTTKTVTANSNPLLDGPFFRRFFNRPLLNRTQEQRSLGSGVIISADGYILTNAHVINDADQILVMLYDGRQAAAEVVGVDTETDLAVLSVEMTSLKAINIGDPNSAQVGDVALAIGNPFGFGQTVTQGIISGTGRNLVDLSSLVNFLQTDAAINDGNSGGALVDVYGNLLGINSRKLESTGSVGLGFAIPADVALKVVKDIVEQGRVVRGWLGIEARQLSDEAASSLGLRRSRAMVVTDLYPGGPGHRAGLEAGDVLVKINGREIIDGRRVINMIANARPGSKLEFEVLRRGQSLTVTAEVDERPEQPL